MRPLQVASPILRWSRSLISQCVAASDLASMRIWLSLFRPVQETAAIMIRILNIASRFRLKLTHCNFSCCFFFRFRRCNCIFAGLWFGKGKPHFPTYLRPFPLAIRELHYKGKDKNMLFKFVLKSNMARQHQTSHAGLFKCVEHCFTIYASSCFFFEI